MNLLRPSGWFQTFLAQIPNESIERGTLNESGKQVWKKKKANETVALFMLCTTCTNNDFNYAVLSPLLIVTFVFHVVDFDQLSIQGLLLPRILHVVRFALDYPFKVIGVKGARKSLIWTDRCKHAGQRAPFIVSPIA